jgi:flagellar basal-body rod modification protein FlgD
MNVSFTTIPSTTSDTASGSSASTGGAASSNKELASKDMFMQLLVAQLKYQNPMNPADGTQFVSQLANFSELEQLISINQGIQTLTTTLTPAASSASQDDGGSTGGSNP